jgi:hypothetical protein
MCNRILSSAVLLLILLLPVLSPQAELVSATSPSAQFDLSCALLDDPEVMAVMSGLAEWVLREQCGGRIESGPALRGPVPAVPPPTGVDVRVNAVDPPSSSTIQSETTLAVNPNTGTICSAFNDSYHFPDQGLAGFSRSTNGGQTWQDGGPFPPSPNGVTWGDPVVVWRQADGYFYFIGMLLNYDGLGLWRSTDECASFQWFNFIHIGTQDDKPFAAVDNNPSSPYYGRFYVAWTDIGISPRRIRLVYSDDGATWTGPFDLSPPGDSSTGAWPAIAPNGDLYIVWLHWVIYDTTISVEGVRSVDGGDSFSSIANPLTNAEAPRDLQSTINCGRPALKANSGDGIRYYVLPQIDVGPDGCLHVVYSYDPDGYNVGDVVDSYYRRSCTNGASWEPEVHLNDDTGLTDQFFPAIAVSADNIVVASWYDRRLDANNYLFDRYWTISYDGGSTWEPNARASDVSSPVYTSSCYHGDYDQMTTYGDAIYHIWSDDRIFFNGHYDPDIWFDWATVPHDFQLAIDPAEHTVCRPAVVTATVSVAPEGIYNQPVLLSDGGVPAGVQTAFTVNLVDPLPGTSTYVITVTESAPEGTYTWLVTGTSPTLTHDVAVTLTVQDCSCDPVHDADFAWTPVTPTVGEVVVLTGTATGTLPITYSWKLDVGSWKAGAVVTHSYDLPGEYQVILSATNCVTATATAVHTVTVLPKPCDPVQDTAFNWAPITPTVGGIVTFTGTATGTLPITYRWKLDVGSWKEGAVVTHSYNLPGEYRVVLTATNCATATATAVHTITVLPKPCDPVHNADFSWSPLTPTVGQVVTFTGSATGTVPITYSWKLEVGSWKTGAVVTHTYAAPGDYAVVLTATNCLTATVTVQHTVQVLPEPGEHYSVYLPLVLREAQH